MNRHGVLRSIVEVFSNFTTLVSGHQVISYFALTFFISWAIWSLSPVLSAGDNDAKLVIILIGAYGPALSAIFVSSIAGREKSGIKNIRKWLVFVSVFLIVNVIWLLSTEKFGPLKPTHPVLFCSKQILAVLAAFVISGIFSSRIGVRDLLLPLTKWRVKLVWYFIVLLGIPLLIVLAIYLAWLLGAPFPAEYYFVQPQSWSQFTPGLLLAYIQTMLFQGPLNEEPGWRGLALPRLQKIRGSIIASIIIGVVWGFWHAPLYWTGIYSGGIEEILGRFLWTIPLAFLFTWVYNHTRGSLLVSILLHTSVNFQGDISSIVLQTLLK